ncbi:MAG: DUF3084 domain-containing protein [Meiothermus sp.]
MTFWSILALLVLVAGLVAYAGDAVAKRVGKRHWRFMGLRPRTTGTLVAIGTGMLIALGAFAAFFLLVRDARETILQAETVRQERDRLRVEVGRLENRAAQAFAENEQLKTDRDEFEKNNDLLARQLEANADLQRQTRQDLEKVLVEREKLQQEVDQLTAASEVQRQALAGLEASRQKLQAEKDALVAEKTRLLSEKAELQASREGLWQKASQAQVELKKLEAASKNALEQFNTLQSRMKELNGRIAKLEADKRTLEGDVSVLVSAKDSDNNGKTLASLQQENAELKSKLNEANRSLAQLRDQGRGLISSLDKTLRLSLLAEGPVESGLEGDAVKEVLRRAESRARALGLRGLEVAETPNLNGLKPGLLLARATGVSPEGKVQVRVEYRAKEQLFAEGDVLATGILVVPASMGEMRRKLEVLSQAAEERLSQAGWIPEKLAQGGISFEEMVSFTSLLSSKRGGARIAVVALDNLYPTDPPKLGLKLLQ